MVPPTEKVVEHYNDWPTTQGFDVKYEEREPVELKVEGTIPAYAAGTLFRTGLGVRDIKSDKGTTYRVNHWFDNLAQVHRFEIHPPQNKGDNVRVTYNSRSTCDGLIARIKETGKRDGFTFGAKYDPCMSIFQKFSALFKPRRLVQRPDDLSISVTLSVNFPGLSRTGLKTEKPHQKDAIQTLCNKSDNELFQMLDPETLEPIGFAYQRTLHPSLVGPMSATHAEVDPQTGDIYNYNMDFVKGLGLYRIFHVSASTAKTSVLATIVADPAYIHSLFITENYVVLCVWNSVYSYGGASVLWNRNIVDSIAPYNPTRRCMWYVVDKKPVEEGGRGHIATYDSDPFFCFHTVNAYEEVGDDGKVNIIADLLAYPDLDIIKRFYIDNLLSDSPKAAKASQQTNCMAELRRFTLPAIPTSKDAVATRGGSPVVAKAITGFIIPKHLSPELPTIDSRRAAKKHRYVYGVAHSGKSTVFESIVKYDVDTQTAKTWSQHGHTAGEPIFVPNPDAKGDDEDDGVLLTVVLDGPLGKSYLLVLDARDLSELGKAHVDGVIGFGFHGTYVSQ